MKLISLLIVPWLLGFASAAGNESFVGELPVVPVSQGWAEPHDQYTGADITKALRSNRCKSGGTGCALRLDAATYPDFDFGQAQGFDATDAANYNRLVMDGAGAGLSIVQPIHPQTKAACSNWIWGPFNFSAVPVAGLTLRGFTVDGRKDQLLEALKSGDPNLSVCAVTLNLLSFSAFGGAMDDILVEDLEIVDGASRGLSVRNTAAGGFVARRITVRDMGCNLTEHGASPSQHDCGFTSAMSPGASRAGNTSDGYCAVCSAGSYCEITDSVCEGATKIGFECFGCAVADFRRNVARYCYGSGFVHNAAAPTAGISFDLHDNLSELNGFSLVDDANSGHGFGLATELAVLTSSGNTAQNNQGYGWVLSPEGSVTSATSSGDVSANNCTDAAENAAEVSVGNAYDSLDTKNLTITGMAVTAGPQCQAAFYLVDTVAPVTIGAGVVVNAPGGVTQALIRAVVGTSAIGPGAPGPEPAKGVEISGPALTGPGSGTGVRFEFGTTGNAVRSATSITSVTTPCDDQGVNTKQSPPC